MKKGNKMKRILLAGLATGLFMFGMVGMANAGLIGVYEIKVFSAVPDYLQIGEIIATQTGTGIDVALASNGATATSTSS